MVLMTIGARAFLGIVFLAAALGKLRSGSALADFTATLRALPWIPTRLHRATAYAVVAAEVAIATTMAVPITVTAGFAAAIVVMVAFTAAMRGAVRRGRAVVCRCFGGRQTTWGTGQLVRNVIIGAVAGAGLLAEATGTAPPASPAASTLVAGLAAIGALACVFGDDLTFVFGLERN